MRKYALLKFLNSDHGVIVRNIFAVAGFLGTLTVCQSLLLAKESFRNFSSNNFKIATRRAGWMTKTFWNIELVGDDLFNFTDGLDEASLLFLLKRLSHLLKKNPSSLRIRSDLLYVLAALMETNQGNFPTYKTQFEEYATHILQASSMTSSDDSERVSKQRKADFDISEARKALSDFSALFSIDIWNWYIISGTFLGLIREGGFLEHDYDIDIGINAEDFDVSRFIQVLDTSDKFFIRDIDYQTEYSFENGQLIPNSKSLALLKIIHLSGINLDIFVHHLEKGIRWHGSRFYRWENKEFTTQRYRFEDVVVNGPVDSNLYLSENYGDWKTPVVNFNCSTGTPNLVAVKCPSSIAVLIRGVAVSGSSSTRSKNISLLSKANFVDRHLTFRFEAIETAN